VILSLPDLFRSNHAHPEPKRPIAAAVNFSLNWSNPPKALLTRISFMNYQRQPTANLQHQY